MSDGYMILIAHIKAEVWVWCEDNHDIEKRWMDAENEIEDAVIKLDNNIELHIVEHELDDIEEETP